MQLQPTIKQTKDHSSPLTVPYSGSRPVYPRPKVRFGGLFGFSSKSESTSSEEVLAGNASTNDETSVSKSTISPPVLKTDLCQAIIAWHKGKKKPEAPCCGYIADPHRTFGLYPQTYYPTPSPAVTLRHLLMDYNENREYDILEKLRVALAISMNILYLYKTPWLARILSLDDIVFFQKSQKTYDPFSKTSHTRKFVKARVETVPYRTESLPKLATRSSCLSVRC